MQARLKTQQKKYLFYSLIAVALFNFISNLMGEEFATLAVNISYIPVAGSLVAVSIMICARFRMSGKHGIAWCLFATFAICWFSAEMIWMVYENVLEIDPYPSPADALWIIGYPLLFLFMILYLQPVKSGISKKVLTISIMISSLVFIPTIYATFQLEEIDYSSSVSDIMLAASYPVGDAVVFVPAMIGVWLFFRGEVNFLWSLVFLAIIATSIADIVFLAAQFDEWYYAGHPIEIIFQWAYLLFAFGVWHHITLFKRSKIASDEQKGQKI